MGTYRVNSTDMGAYRVNSTDMGAYKPWRVHTYKKSHPRSARRFLSVHDVQSY